MARRRAQRLDATVIDSEARLDLYPAGPLCVWGVAVAIGFGALAAPPGAAAALPLATGRP